MIDGFKAIFNKLKHPNIPKEEKEKHCLNLVKKLEALDSSLFWEIKNLNVMSTKLGIYQFKLEDGKADHTTMVKSTVQDGNEVLDAIIATARDFHKAVNKAKEKLEKGITKGKYPEIVEIDTSFPIGISEQLEKVMERVGIFCYRHGYKPKGWYKIRIRVDMH